MRHPANSYDDLTFLIKDNFKSGELVPPKFNSRGEAQAGAEYLECRLPAGLKNTVKWFHSGMTDEFCEGEMHALFMGKVFGHASTNTTGMVNYLITYPCVLNHSFKGH